MIAFWGITLQVAGQKQASSFRDSIPFYFNEIRLAAEEYQALWNRNLYGAMLFVEPRTRELFANEPDTGGVLKPAGDIYVGILPDTENIANTAINWSGKKWAMIMLPLPRDKEVRINLLAHELFHKAQPSLGFTLHNAENNHLDKESGRIYLRLELEALKKAVGSPTSQEQQEHLRNALAFRKYRRLLYSGADTTENLLELNEGIAEFTGEIISGRDKKQAAAHFINGIDKFFGNPTFVRSFAYYTIPVYGYLLYKRNRDWNKEITTSTDLTAYFMDAFNIRVPADLETVTESIAGNYNGETIMKEEAIREEKRKKLVAGYRRRFIEQPHCEIQFEKVSISFDPRNIVPLEDKGSVYPNIRVTDAWGILTVEGGALVAPGWDRILVTNPTGADGKKITGDGWTLELADGYTLEKDEESGNYKVARTGNKP
ncbi:hypothetical protein LX66_4766 [Chitinophaga japonensis]|uniref:Uncharacterized protein n=1 Tax=Chitinophaga japonensis TaxID=104662 RepID=A0A562SSY5_CHIJA|nr:hypothetical protein LX66_4766 [Chitinophaga japonensis]